MERPFYTSNAYSVCYDCKDRHVGCHGECELYLDEKKCAEASREQARKKMKEKYIGMSGNKKRQKEAILRWYRSYGV